MRTYALWVPREGPLGPLPRNLLWECWERWESEAERGGECTQCGEGAEQTRSGLWERHAQGHTGNEWREKREEHGGTTPWGWWGERCVGKERGESWAEEVFRLLRRLWTCVPGLAVKSAGTTWTLSQVLSQKGRRTHICVCVHMLYNASRDIYVHLPRACKCM